MSTLDWTITLISAYLCGSIPFGLLIGRMKGIDIRQHGSGNIGATNVARVLGRGVGRVCLAFDMLKGFLPVAACALTLGVSPYEVPTGTVACLWLAVAAAPVLGHVFPVWLGFKGGKGVATAFGSLVAVFPVITIAALLALLTWILLAKLTRFVSVASIGAAIALPLSIPITPWIAARCRIISDVTAKALMTPEGILPYAAICVALAALVIVMHRANIGRLRAGTESRIPSRSGVPAQLGPKSGDA